MNDVNFEYLLTRNNKKIAVATLNAPKSLNAININMVDLLYQQLVQWQCDDEVVAVFLQGSGERAFCAGGDVVSLYQEYACGALSLPIEDKDLVGTLAYQFFKQEYKLDLLIHEYTKPVIAWGSGYVMGGGIGLFAGASHRVVTETTLMAMPEITIGLYPDVGASYFLNKVESNIGLYLALTGQTFNAKDAKHIKLADYLLPSNVKLKFFERLCDLAWHGDKSDYQLLGKMLTATEKLSCDDSNLLSLPSPIIENKHRIASACQQLNLADVFTEINELAKKNSWLEQAAKKLTQGSPLSAAIIFKQLQETKSHTLNACFLAELNLSLRCCQFTEFYEGVRALLVDKDKSPNWAYKSVTDIDQQILENFFKPISALNMN